MGNNKTKAERRAAHRGFEARQQQILIKKETADDAPAINSPIQLAASFMLNMCDASGSDGIKTVTTLAGKKIGDIRKIANGRLDIPSGKQDHFLGAAKSMGWTPPEV